MMDQSSSKASQIGQFPIIYRCPVISWFTNFYQWIHSHFSDVAKPLNALLQKTQNGMWMSSLKRLNILISSLLQTNLSIPDWRRAFLVEADSSGYATVPVLSQSVMTIMASCCVHQQKVFLLLDAITTCMTKRCYAVMHILTMVHYLNAKQPVQILTNHKLEYFMTAQKLITNKHTGLYIYPDSISICLIDRVNLCQTRSPLEMFGP